MGHSNQSRWRTHAAKVISEVVGTRNPRRMNADELKELRKEISDAYPFGERRMHPYKIWLSEVKFQLGLNGFVESPTFAGEGLFEQPKIPASEPDAMGGA